MFEIDIAVIDTRHSAMLKVNFNCLTAEEYLSFAFQRCHMRARKNKRLILIYLLPVKMLLVWCICFLYGSGYEVKFLIAMLFSELFLHLCSKV